MQRSEGLFLFTLLFFTQTPLLFCLEAESKPYFPTYDFEKLLELLTMNQKILIEVFYSKNSLPWYFMHYVNNV